jgi:hypothetical protein
MDVCPSARRPLRQILTTVFTFNALIKHRFRHFVKELMAPKKITFSTCKLSVDMAEYPFIGSLLAQPLGTQGPFSGAVI